MLIGLVDEVCFEPARALFRQRAYACRYLVAGSCTVDLERGQCTGQRIVQVELDACFKAARKLWLWCCESLGEGHAYHAVAVAGIDRETIQDIHNDARPREKPRFLCLKR